MRIALAFAIGLLTVQATGAQAPAASTPAARPPTMKELMLDVAVKAYRGAKERKLEAMTDLNTELYESCQSCHVHYRPGDRRRPS